MKTRNNRKIRKSTEYLRKQGCGGRRKREIHVGKRPNGVRKWPTREAQTKAAKCSLQKAHREVPGPAWLPGDARRASTLMNVVYLDEVSQSACLCF